MGAPTISQIATSVEHAYSEMAFERFAQPTISQIATSVEHTAMGIFAPLPMKPTISQIATSVEHLERRHNARNAMPTDHFSDSDQR